MIPAFAARPHHEIPFRVADLAKRSGDLHRAVPGCWVGLVDTTDCYERVGPMSDLATAKRLRQSTTQFPASWYCDPRVLEVERRVLLAKAPGYVGHELMVPEAGDYQVLQVRNDAQMLVRNAGGIDLLSNICRHRQARMLDGRGTRPSIVCPLHRWTYDLTGELLGAPHFPDKPCLNLARTP